MRSVLFPSLGWKNTCWSCKRVIDDVISIVNVEAEPDDIIIENLRAFSKSIYKSRKIEKDIGKLNE